MSRQRFNAAQWGAWLKEFDQSDLTVQQFCDSKGTSVNTFYNWRKRLRAANGEASHSMKAKSKFVSVSIPAAQMEIELPGGAIARVPNDRESLRLVLEVLLELGVKS